MFSRIVTAIEVAALLLAALFVVLLFAYRPGSVAPSRHLATEPVGAATGRLIFTDNCATCHGSRGEGDIGPKLAGGTVVTRYPDERAEIAVVTDGRDGMPAWSGRLTAAQIRAVVDYTRNSL
jgi:mono/diheme cytochrome c family protein